MHSIRVTLSPKIPSLWECDRAPKFGWICRKAACSDEGGGQVVSQSSRPAEQHRHLLIRHGLLQSQRHGLAQVHCQDVFALPGKIGDRLKTRGPAGLQLPPLNPSGTPVGNKSSSLCSVSTHQTVQMFSLSLDLFLAAHPKYQNSFIL